MARLSIPRARSHVLLRTAAQSRHVAFIAPVVSLGLASACGATDGDTVFSNLQSGGGNGTGGAVTATHGSVPNRIDAWAFARCGRSLYLYRASGSGANSEVSRYTPGGSTSTSTSVVVSNSQHRIFGAGDTTCAPLLEPPA